MHRKQADLTILDHQKAGGRIRITTPGPDRDRDRVITSGGRITNYMQNPIVQWGHNYWDPWATIGRTISLSITPEGMDAEFELRPAATDQDPQNIILLLWEQQFIRTASIGFQPESAVPNELGGHDFPVWDLLEWSLVPIPANQEALRLAAKAYPNAYTNFYKAGRVLSRANEDKIRSARAALDEVLSQIESMPDDEDPTPRTPTIVTLAPSAEDLARLAAALSAVKSAVVADALTLGT